MHYNVQAACFVASFVFTIVLARTFVLLFKIRRKRSVQLDSFPVPVVRRTDAAKVMVVAGSGGHTTEILKLISALSKENYSPRLYVVAETDTLSAERIKMMEDGKDTQYTITKIQRSREVHQSWASTVVTSLIASISSVFLVFKSRPDLLLCNGPGTCVPLCFAAFLSSVVGWKRVKVVFVESFCRARTLSLSGHLLYYISDEFLVQWPYLVEKYRLTRYIGRLV